jgi:hypothetical protein
LGGVRASRFGPFRLDSGSRAVPFITTVRLVRLAPSRDDARDLLGVPSVPLYELAFSPCVGSNPVPDTSLWFISVDHQGRATGEPYLVGHLEPGGVLPKEVLIAS